MNNNFKKAFSLIEISMVILVVGILIAGISKGIDMVYDMRLATARALTDKAPMFGMENLELWLETTSENSLATGTGASFTNVINPEDNQAIGKWNDLNPTTVNSTYKNHAIQATSGYQPLYIKDGINGLPALLFDGVDDYFYANDGKTNFAEFTLFIVFFSQPKSTTTSNYGNLINVGCNGWVTSCVLNSSVSGYSISGSGGNPVIWIFVNNSNNSLSLMQTINSGTTYLYSSYGVNMIGTIPRISKINFSNTQVKMSVNLKQSSTASSSPLVIGTNYLNFRIGTQKGNGEASNNRNYKGYIGEIILFGRSLGDQETKLIENYLSEKWRIVL